MIADPTNIFDVMMEETAKSMGINPDSIYRTCDEKITRDIYRKSCESIRIFCKQFIRQQMDE